MYMFDKKLIALFLMYNIQIARVKGCAKVSQYITAYGNFLKSILTWLMWIKFHEISIQYSDAKWSSMLRLQVIITETVRVQVHTKE